MTLDSFRAFFIIVVMAFHYLVAWAPPFHEENLYGFATTYDPYFALGNLGVEAFFVLSGTFITVTVLRSSDAIDFAYRRFSRIYPALVIAAIVSFAFLNTVGLPEFHTTPLEFVASIALVAWQLGLKYVDGAYWSLAVEVKFYIWVAIMFWLLRERFWVGLIVLQIAGALIELVALKVGKVIFLANYMPFFLCGTAIAYQTFLKQPKVATILYAMSAVFFVIHWPALPIKQVPLIVSNLAILFVVAVLIAVTSLDIRLEWAPLARLGLVSYEIYLIHQNIGVTLIHYLKLWTRMPDIAAISIVVLAVYGLAELLHLASERVRTNLNSHYRAIRLRVRPAAQGG
ncbi:peptidoglycan/LPS O-acetylase OafA/YrhL [Rhizobium leguminosarum]|uniref:Peptidoglycan/LPS O-acetylase OafA/YrhL n=1 Tax=Rhizobium leguminosarum TaxID=384 RepID=A0AAE2T0X0_RHILE|nr:MULTISPECIES: acyltransferase [Rhizobium]MBB4294013.1 peptidoglycan/LPS O-acetylase OafA/YrhL [Rhizobium leguminosarum]MBB4300376.1 peptidoglycan/LPS O-acetylase OafA/YrhL [Rhizobium leguminosarum]MBB4311671.1 peptidoglycan/LPS O-acetylase OafA/YrhL [Rhizobium leguminosarum]MBB4420689.1 peptidoglycan/LPS O-acetylase OafA/YrhL [Rhizobium leguminosarum]MBB4435879.1 peptidoglycan/LPS O-acetylase OafA/YrhL [Rhizobium esperanzae]